MSERGRVLPIYLIVDESASMRPVVNELNAGFSHLHHAMLTEPMAAAGVRVSLLGFADTVRWYLRLSDLRQLDRMPTLGVRGKTNYGQVFTQLAAAVRADVAVLREAGHVVHRPVGFFLSDGRPTDENWPEAHRQLLDRKAHPCAPNIVAFGIGTAQPGVILRVASRPEFAFVAVPGAEVATEITRFCAGLTGSIVYTSRRLTSNQPELVVAQPTGFRLAIDVV